MEVNPFLRFPLSIKEILYNWLSDFIVFVFVLHIIHTYVCICQKHEQQIQYTYKFLRDVNFVVNWSSAKFSSSKFHWQNFGFYQL